MTRIQVHKAEILAEGVQSNIEHANKHFGNPLSTLDATRNSARSAFMADFDVDSFCKRMFDYNRSPVFTWRALGRKIGNGILSFFTYPVRLFS